MKNIQTKMFIDTDDKAVLTQELSRVLVSLYKAYEGLLDYNELARFRMLISEILMENDRLLSRTENWEQIK